MISKINPRWEFNDCTGYLVETFKGTYGQKAKVYIASLMPKIQKSNGAIITKENIHTKNQIFINDESSMPTNSSYVTHMNYIEVPVDNDVIMKQANEELYEKYHNDFINRSPIYFLPFIATLEMGKQVSVISANNDLTNLKVKV